MKTPRRFILNLSGELPSRNECELVSRGNRYAAASQKKRHTQRVAQCALRCRDVAWVPMERYRVQVTWRCKDKRRDPDNIFGGGIKFLLDGLQMAEIVTGDGWKNVQSIVSTWTVDAEAPGVMVELVEVE